MLEFRRPWLEGQGQKLSYQQFSARKAEDSTGERGNIPGERDAWTAIQARTRRLRSCRSVQFQYAGELQGKVRYSPRQKDSGAEWPYTAKSKARTWIGVKRNVLI